MNKTTLAVAFIMLSTPVLAQSNTQQSQQSTQYTSSITTDNKGTVTASSTTTTNVNESTATVTLTAPDGTKCAVELTTSSPHQVLAMSNNCPIVAR